MYRTARRHRRIVAMRRPGRRRGAELRCTRGVVVGRLTSVHRRVFVRWSSPQLEDPMADRRTLLRQTADLAADFLEGVGTRKVRASATHDELLSAFGGAL